MEWLLNVRLSRSLDIVPQSLIQYNKGAISLVQRLSTPGVIVLSGNGVVMTGNVDEDKVVDVAHAMLANGLLDAGYKYINV